MRIAFVTPIFPYPDSGGGIHSFNTIKKLQSQGHEVSLFTCTDKKITKKHHHFLKKEKIKRGKIVFNPFISGDVDRAGKRLLFLKNIFDFTPFTTIKFFSKKIEQSIDEYIKSKKVNCLWINYISIANYIRKHPQFKTILQSHGMESVFFKSMFLKDRSYRKKIFALIEYLKYYFFEKKYVPRFSKVYAISELDKIELEKIRGKKDVEVIIPKVEIQKINRVKRLKNIILFIGYIDWYPNKDGLVWFIKKIFPLIQKEIKDAKLWIIGKFTDKTQLYDNPNIVYFGYQKNIDRFFSKASVFIAPIRYGNGVRIKVLTAMSYKMPIVSTSMGVEGIFYKKYKNITITDEEKSFAQAVISFTKDKT